MRSDEFHQIEFGKTAPTAFSLWPTKENSNSYKFNSIFFELNQEVITYERSTYSLLEWLGDVGGLVEGLSIMGTFIIGPMTTLAIKKELLSHIFRL